MARWTDLAAWRGPTVNQGGAAVEQRGVVIHIAEGTFEGTIAWQRNPTADVSSHFVVARDGRIAQMVDTDVTAWTQRAGNGHWLSIENEGHTPNPLSEAQVEANAKILARWHAVYGGPLQLATSPSGRGLGHHSMGAESGVNWGHSDCPGPAIKAQKPAILARAIEIANGGDDDMFEDKDRDALTSANYRTYGLWQDLDVVDFTITSGRKFHETNVAKAARVALDKKLTAVLTALGGVDEAVAAQLKGEFDEIDANLAAARVEVAEVDDQVLQQLGARQSPEEAANLLRAVLGDDAAAVGALLVQG